MNGRRAAIGLLTVVLIAGSPDRAGAQRPSPEVRRAQPVEESVPRALPVEEETPAPTPRPRRTEAKAPAATAAPTDAAEEASSPSGHLEATTESEAPEKRQLDYANALFARKLYDLAVPEYEKFLGQFPNAAGRASAQFYLAECYRSLNRSAAARTSFQAVLDQFAESEFAGPAAYGVGEILFTAKDYAGALPLFHRSAAKSKEPALALSARYFEARCLENLDRKDEAVNAYLQVIDAKNPNPFRDDARVAAGSILLVRGRKADAFHQYEALASEAGKPALKAEAAVRAGLVAIDLQQADKGKVDKGMTDKAIALLQKGRGAAEGGRWRAIAQVGLLRLQYASGQFAQLISDYKKGQEQIPEDARAEIMLLVGNSHRQLGHASEADEIYRQIVAKYPGREEAKDAQYQRLINLYNANDPALLREVDSFLSANGTGERADQARLLKAEALYKEQNFAAAAPIYAELRSSQLSPRLRAEAAYKLGWCYVQLKDATRTIEAFAYFLKAFPDNPQAPASFRQRALAYETTKNYSAAIDDLNVLLANYPNVREREAALQQRALLFGQQNDPVRLIESFQQLLKEFPKSAAAAQANYLIGKTAFEAKNYKLALPALDAARKMDKQQYGTPATLRIISSEFYLRDRAALANEVNGFVSADPNAQVPSEILEWLGLEFYNEKNFAAADKYLSLLGKSENAAKVKPDFWFYLGDAETKLKNFTGAEFAYERYLQAATDPAAKAKVLLALGATKIASHKPDDAQKIAEEIMTLQPEGHVNAEARLLAGDAQMERAHFDEAGKAYMGVALLYEGDTGVGPRALQKAAQAYSRAGKQDEAERVARQLHEKYPNYAGG
ncbi:MAG: tetratricopeptide repeat protein [Chthoniobacterales bacterium]